jgi:UDP-N-acetylenolpyruvoylglucosamine reductase
MAIPTSVGVALMDQARAYRAEKSRTVKAAAFAKAVGCVQVGYRRQADRSFSDARIPQPFTS